MGSNDRCPAPAAGPALGLVGLCSIQLSYGRSEPGQLPGSEGEGKRRISLGEWRPTARDLVRFWAKVRREGHAPGGCWIWTGALTGVGYGSFGIVARRPPVVESAHRVSWRLEHGRAPDGILMHKCDTPACVAPHHLVEGTNADNMVDALHKGRLGRRARQLIGKERLAEEARRSLTRTGAMVAQLEAAGRDTRAYRELLEKLWAGVGR